MTSNFKKLLLAALVVALAACGYYGWTLYRGPADDAGLAGGNGRLEATEIDVATKFPGRLADVLVHEGDFVTAGQPLAHLQSDNLLAQRAEAVARFEQAVQAVAGADAQTALREADLEAARALVTQREAELDAAERRLARAETLATEGATSRQELDDDRARTQSARAALAATRAQTRAAAAAIVAARAQVTGARSAVTAAKATVTRIDADLADSVLKAPRDARVQLRLAEPGEILGAGGRVLSLVDLTDVQMSFFLPETLAGRVALGSEVRIVLDAAPQFVIPATVSFVASTAQFTPKTVETVSERQKLMFRIKARIAPELLRKHLQQVKTGLPGLAWLRTDPAAAWPARLALRAEP